MFVYDLQLPKASKDLAEYKADFNKLINVFLIELESLSKTDMNVKKLYLRLNFNGFYKSKDPEEEEEDVVNESDEGGDKAMKSMDSHSVNSGGGMNDDDDEDYNTAKGEPKTMGVLDSGDDDDDF